MFVRPGLHAINGPSPLSSGIRAAYSVDPGCVTLRPRNLHFEGLRRITSGLPPPRVLRHGGGSRGGGRCQFAKGAWLTTALPTNTASQSDNSAP